MSNALSATGPAADDSAVVTAVAAGDLRAFEALMRRYNRQLYRTARAVLRDDAEAEDALQEAYLCAFRGMQHFRGEASLSTWLSRLVLNECFGRMRRAARRENVIPMISATAHAMSIDLQADKRETPLDAASRTQMRALLEQKVDELPEAYRTVFILRSVQEMSVDETAQVLGLQQETVRSRHFRAKSLLRESLAQDLDLAERDLYDFGGARCERIAAAVLFRIGAGPGSSSAA